MKGKFRADLHIHTCLSPCGDNEMVPKTIVRKATEKNLDMIAICDHNCCDNAMAVIEAAKDTKLTVFPGLEVTSKEEAHTVALFENHEDAGKMQELILKSLPDKNDAKTFGQQPIVDKNGDTVDINKKFLLGAPDISIDEIVKKIKELGGIAIAAHIDRDFYSVLRQLGFIPEGLNFDALEISPRMDLKDTKKNFPEYSRFPFIASSDAHFPDDIGRAWSEFELSDPSFGSLKEYFRQRHFLVTRDK